MSLEALHCYVVTREAHISCANRAVGGAGGGPSSESQRLPLGVQRFSHFTQELYRNSSWRELRDATPLHGAGGARIVSESPVNQPTIPRNTIPKQLRRAFLSSHSSRRVGHCNISRAITLRPIFSSRAVWESTWPGTVFCFIWRVSVMLPHSDPCSATFVLKVPATDGCWRIGYVPNPMLLRRRTPERKRRVV